MRPATLLAQAAALAALAAAAPTYPDITTSDADSDAEARSIQVMSSYYNLLAEKVAAYKSSNAQPTCDLSNVKMPPSSLPPPSAGLSLSHIAVGRGTQNYTCTTGNATAAPVATGAVATLFNASCIASAYPDLLATLPSVALQYSLGTSSSLSGSPITGPTEMRVSGEHYFSAAGAPFFDMRAAASPALGETTCARLNATAAPAGSTPGPAGETAVPWLRLNVTSHVAGGAKEVYRLSTAGGSAPPTCEGMGESIVIEYSALYWFYS